MTQPDYYREAITVSVPVDERPGEVHILIGSDPIRVRLTRADTLSVVADLLEGVRISYDYEENP